MGGRLANAEIAFERKQPIILPSKGIFKTLLIDDTHKRTLHGGIQLTLQHLRQRFWIVSGRATVASRLKKCVGCFRYKQKVSQK